MKNSHGGGCGAAMMAIGWLTPDNMWVFWWGLALVAFACVMAVE